MIFTASFSSATVLLGKSNAFNAVILLKLQRRFSADMWHLPISLIAYAFSVKHIEFACDKPEQVIANEAPPASAFDVLMKALT